MTDLTEPFSCWAGPKVGVRLLLVGEAWGQTEDIHKAPFVGHSGKELLRMLGDAGVGAGESFNTLKKCLFAGDELMLQLREAWLEENSIAMTNVFNLRPQGNKLEALCDPAGKGLRFGGNLLPPLVRSPKHGYVAEEYLGHLARLGREVLAANPCVTLALGAAALWGLSAALAPRGAAHIGSHSDIRGTILEFALANPKDAKDAYDAKAKQLFGEFARS